jgi:hypothetical protein
VVRGYEGRGKKYALVVWVLIDLVDVLHDDLILLLLRRSQEKHVSLHAMNKEARNYLDVWIRLLYSLQVLLTVVFACIQDYSLSLVCSFFPEIVIAGDEVIEFFEVLEGQLYSLFAPR